MVKGKFDSADGAMLGNINENYSSSPFNENEKRECEWAEPLVQRDLTNKMTIYKKEKL